MAVRVLHFHSGFDLGGKEARAVRLMNAFGDRVRHTVVSGVPEWMSARAAIAPDIAADFPDAPPLSGRWSLRRLKAIARFMRGYDLVLTYNWGAFDAVMARRLFGGPPLVHHEDGFNEDEAAGLHPGRNLYRRIGLTAAARLVVPSRTLKAVALHHWGLKRERVRVIPNGIDLTKAGEGAPLPGFSRAPGELAIVTVAGLRRVKNLPALVAQVAALNRVHPARLAVLGEGPEREAIEAAARGEGIADRVFLPGFVAEPVRYLASFDIFALSSLSEQFPISVIEGMAAALPIVSPDVGDVRAMVSAENRPLIGGASALADLAADPEARRLIGSANRTHAFQAFDEHAMIAAYAALYGEAIGRRGAFG